MKCDEKEEGKPNFSNEFPYNFFINAEHSFSKIEEAPDYLFLAIKRFRQYYGPSKEEEEEFRRQNRNKNTACVELDYINTIMEYWFEKREKLKERSSLHRLLLEK